MNKYSGENGITYIKEWKIKIMVAEINVLARTLEKKKVFVSSNSSGAPYGECHTEPLHGITNNCHPAIIGF